MNRDAWSELSYFQSFDLVRREYADWHGRKLNCERTWEIVSAFVQGQEYFASADSAAEAVSPLLLYYAILSISRALIIFLEGKSEATLKSAHGLNADGWEETIKSKDKSVLDLTVAISDGSFSELAKATNNSIIVRYERHDGHLILTPTSPILGESAPGKMTFRDLLSREPELCSLYREIARAAPNAYPGTTIVTGKELIVQLVKEPDGGIDSEEKVKSLFLVPSDVDVTFDPPDPSCPFPHPHYSYHLPHASGGFSSARPIVEHPSNSHRGYIIAPWPNSGYLSPLLRCFVEAYFLGMLARYFPALWMRLIRGQSGDAVVPLLRRTIQHLKDDFPRLARSELRQFRV